MPWHLPATRSVQLPGVPHFKRSKACWGINEAWEPSHSILPGHVIENTFADMVCDDVLTRRTKHPPATSVSAG